MMSETMPYDKKFLDVNGRKIAYVDEGSGNPIVLLHGNPMSSFLWRNVAPELLASGRVIIPDLIGHGDSDKLPASMGPERYTLEVAYDYLSGLLHGLDINANVTLVIHDWGSALGFMWAMRNSTAVRPGELGRLARRCQRYLQRFPFRKGRRPDPQPQYVYRSRCTHLYYQGSD